MTLNQSFSLGPTHLSELLLWRKWVYTLNTHFILSNPLVSASQGKSDRNHKQNSQFYFIVVLNCKAPLTESCKSKSISTLSPYLHYNPKKLRRISFEPLALPNIQLQTMLSLISYFLAKSLVPVSQVFFTLLWTFPFFILGSGKEGNNYLRNWWSNDSF